MKRKCDRQIILEDGSKYSGFGFGDMQDKILEIVFNTSMVGYQEILSDPSYTDQAVVMTYPLIGNYGMCDDDYETGRPTIGAFLVHEYNDEPSNFRSTESLGSVMKRFGIPGVSGLDTRKLNRSIRDFGTRKCLINPGFRLPESADYHPGDNVRVRACRNPEHGPSEGRGIPGQRPHHRTVHPGSRRDERRGETAARGSD